MTQFSFRICFLLTFIVYVLVAFSIRKRKYANLLKINNSFYVKKYKAKMFYKFTWKLYGKNLSDALG